ncbi:MAG: PLDc N-terminal domain-containing protein [Alphaproteobacteria bacterium]
MFEGLLGLLHLIVAIWAIINIVQSGASALAKALWIIFVLVLPLIGLIVWFLVGPKSSTA